MDITPNSDRIQEVIHQLPHVRDKWQMPQQRQWAQRIWTLVKGTNAPLVAVTDQAIGQATRNIEMELGIQPGESDIRLTRTEWEQATRAIGHTASAAAIYAIADASHQIHQLEQGFASDASGDAG